MALAQSTRTMATARLMAGLARPERGRLPGTSDREHQPQGTPLELDRGPQLMVEVADLVINGHLDPRRPPTEPRHRLLVLVVAEVGDTRLELHRVHTMLLRREGILQRRHLVR